MGNSGAFELVTGHGAEPHVDADDHALLYASFIGSGVYRLTGVKTAEIEVTSENEVTISPGMFLIHGRFARVKDPISLSIETGSQGQNRNDLVVCEYSYSGNETEIDDMELVVVTGTPANPGSETDPSIEDDLTLFDIEYGGSITDETIIQVPLWRVPKEGLTTQDPVALFKDYVDATTARDSISHIQVRTRRNVSFNVTSTASQSVTSISGFEDIDPDSIVAFIPTLSACSVSSVNAAALWNTDNGHNDLQLVTSQAQTIKVNLTVVYTID
jgi:hypothetical protein